MWYLSKSTYLERLLANAEGRATLSCYTELAVIFQDVT